MTTEPGSYEEYMALSRAQMTRDRDAFTGSLALSPDVLRARWHAIDWDAINKTVEALVDAIREMWETIRDTFLDALKWAAPESTTNLKSLRRAVEPGKRKAHWL